MRIALLAPIWNQISDKPTLYGVPVIVRDLALGLKKRGHRVTLFCAAGSKVDVEMFTSLEFSLKDKEISIMGNCENIFYSFKAAAKALKEAEGKFDIIHSHMDFFPLPFAPFIETPMVTTIHGAWFSDGAKEIFNTYKDEPFVSLSDATRKNLSDLNYVATVYNGIDLAQFPFEKRRGNYLLFLGRFVADKGADLAIKVAKATKAPLLLAGTTHDADKDYFQSKILKEVDGKKICFVGPIHGERKTDLLKNALVLLFPIRWEEPFGLAMLEAMVCGTPVIAFNRGSTLEIVKDGVTGYVIQTQNSTHSIDSGPSALSSGSKRLMLSGSTGSPSRAKSRDKVEASKRKTQNFKIKKTGVEGMVEGVKEIKKLSNLEIKKLRRNCRRHVEKKFTLEKMVKSYEGVYEKVLGSRC